MSGRIGAEIKRRREEQGLSMSELSGIAGVSTNYLSQLENGEFGYPGVQMLLKLARALGVSIDALLGEPGDGTEPEPVDVPGALLAMAQEARLPAADVAMLAPIRYRGRAPATPDDWRFVYEAIRRAVGGRT